MKKVNFAPHGPIAGDMHQYLVELAALSEAMPQAHKEKARPLLHALFEGVARVSTLELAANIYPKQTSPLLQ